MVEDEYFVADEPERELRRRGVVVAGPVGTMDDALLEIVSGSVIDAAVLDLRLDEEETSELADGPRATGIPFVFASGNGTSAIPERHRRVPHFEKPCDLDRLAATVAELLH